MPTQFSIARLVDLIFQFYSILIIIRIFLTWLPSIDWEAQPFSFLRNISDVYLNIFRKIIPPIGGVLDISPVLALIVLEIIRGIFVGFFS